MKQFPLPALKKGQKIVSEVHPLPPLSFPSFFPQNVPALQPLSNLRSLAGRRRRCSDSTTQARRLQLCSQQPLPSFGELKRQAPGSNKTLPLSPFLTATAACPAPQLQHYKLLLPHAGEKSRTAARATRRAGFFCSSRLVEPPGMRHGPLGSGKSPAA